MKNPKRTTVSIYDTVLVPFPGSGVYELFRDISNKGNSLTNMRMQCRLGGPIVVDSVSVDLRHWSGDDMREFLLLLGSVTLRVSNRHIATVPVRALSYGARAALPSPCLITADDDLRGQVEVSDFPWNPPKLIEYAEKREVHHETCRWPTLLQRLDKFSLLPTWEKTVTSMVPQLRPRQGSVTVTVILHGLTEEPAK